MTRTHRLHVFAVLAASALALSSCSSADQAEEQTTSQSQETSQTAPQSPASRDPAAAEKAHDVDLDALKEVSPEPFLSEEMYTFAFPDTGSGGCAIPETENAMFPFGCDATFSDGARFTLEYDPVVGFTSARESDNRVVLQGKAGAVGKCCVASEGEHRILGLGDSASAAASVGKGERVHLLAQKRLWRNLFERIEVNIMRFFRRRGISAGG